MDLHLRGYHPLWPNFHRSVWLRPVRSYRDPAHHIFPAFRQVIQFALFPFHSPLLRKSLLFSFPPPTKMFQFGGFPSAERMSPRAQEVPFGDPRIEACVQLPVAFRSLPRPSSAPEPSHPQPSVARYYGLLIIAALTNSDYFYPARSFG